MNQVKTVFARSKVFGVVSKIYLRSRVCKINSAWKIAKFAILSNCGVCQRDVTNFVAKFPTKKIGSAYFF